MDPLNVTTKYNLALWTLKQLNNGKCNQYYSENSGASVTGLYCELCGGLNNDSIMKVLSN